MGSAAGGKAMAAYLLAGTLKPDTANAAAYYLAQERAAAWVEAQIEQGRGNTVAELRPDLSPEPAARLGIDPREPLTPDGIANLLNVTRLDGRAIPGRQKQNTADRDPTGFIDLTFSGDKSLSVAWALAPTTHERDLLLDIHREAVADTMAYLSTQIGLTRREKGGAAVRSRRDCLGQLPALYRPAIGGH